MGYCATLCFTYVAAATLVGVVVTDVPRCKLDGSYQLFPKADCTGYYLCVFERAVEMPDCPPGSKFSVSAHVCVPEGSYYDDCKVDSATTEVPPPTTAATLVGVVVTDVPRCKLDGSYQLFPKANCKGYYLCVFGRAVEMPDCPPGSKFSVSGHVCVPEGSYYDDCKVDSATPEVPPPIREPLTIGEQCQNGAGVIAHGSECQLYYNCSHTYDTVPRYFEQHLMECPYPQLFSETTHKCEPFTNVECGARMEHKNGCGYRRNQCASAHCMPCSFRFPSCEGLPDGVNQHDSKPWSPYFVVCYEDRTVTENTCPRDYSGRVQLFHPELNECVSLDNIPREHGGTMPDCTGKPDGFYLDDFGRCDQYTYCKNGKFLNSVKCMEGEVFDSENEVCRNEEDACGPCGLSLEC